MAMMGRSTGGDGTMTPPTPVNAPFQRLTRTRSTWSAGSKRRHVVKIGIPSILENLFIFFAARWC